MDWRALVFSKRVLMAFVAAALCFMLAVLAMKPASAQTEAHPLKAGVSKSMYLPEEMYGYWSVTGTLIETNAPKSSRSFSFNPMLHDIWVLEQSGEEVTISNPVRGASASINVERVDGQTATFYRTTVLKNNMVLFEMPTVTVDADRLDGTMLNQVRTVVNGKVVQSFYARYRIEARRMGGEKIRFQQNRLEPMEPNLEIDERRLRTPR